MEKLSEKSDEELNRMAAEAMGWVLDPNVLGTDPPEPAWIALNGDVIFPSEWSPTTNLNHTFRLLEYLICELNYSRRFVEIRLERSGLKFASPHDDTSLGIARAITVCFLRAKRAEEIDAKWA